MKEPEPRIIKVNIGGVDFEIPRDEDDPRPDHVITIGGVEINLETGDIKPAESQEGMDYKKMEEERKHNIEEGSRAFGVGPPEG